MTKRLRNNRINNKKIRRPHNNKERLKKAPPLQKSVDEWLQIAETHMTTAMDVEAAYSAYQQAHSALLIAQQQESSAAAAASSSLLEQLLHVLEKMGEIQVSLNDPDRARQHFLQALQLVEAQPEYLQQHSSSSCRSSNMLETHANFCLYLGQLSIEQQALEAYLKGVASLEKCLELVESNVFDVVDDDADDAMATTPNDDGGHAAAAPTLQKEQQILQLKQKLSGAYCNVADLYLTDLCDEETAERDCEHYLQKALQLFSQNDNNNNNNESATTSTAYVAMDALQTMANLRLSQHEDRRLEAVEYILQAYEQQRVGSEALAALVGLHEGGGGVGKRRHASSTDDAEMQEDNDDHDNSQGQELLEVDAANNLPEFEFRCQTAKILLECADLLSKRRIGTDFSGDEPSSQETQCIDAAISVLGSLLAQNDEVVEIWYLMGCAFAAKSPPLADVALFYLERAQSMLNDIRKGLSQELQFASDDMEQGELEQELEQNDEQMQDVVTKMDEISSLASITKEDATMGET